MPPVPGARDLFARLPSFHRRSLAVHTVVPSLMPPVPGARYLFARLSFFHRRSLAVHTVVPPPMLSVTAEDESSIVVE